jgi:hypothetical protein
MTKKSPSPENAQLLLSGGKNLKRMEAQLDSPYFSVSSSDLHVSRGVMKMFALEKLELAVNPDCLAGDK